ncbi:Methyltransferase FkbM [Nitrosococcus oceani ATCC 19707]|uniref:Methyltransferase FkbM n=2 Tax=Nitrosococcus oceani TaxID=1229 RepID=Q3JD36_NITOC|nr:FkbM family methyltransferase [Nitrosococcus oceani]ABA57260.1 Methyltransferase FkbM [Nitrosococcus oceani ATCC 19707]EDZ66386.1 methyltransferase, FkbM family protein [Nitrosococcus oceani AFC27]KFI20234.1 methyltransferase FkbM [Nitrosococcus oceani C-27]GEM20132.1 methyltransferase FkbM [Nitrosococcus oceani]
MEQLTKKIFQLWNRAWTKMPTDTYSIEGKLNQLLEENKRLRGEVRKLLDTRTFYLGNNTALTFLANGSKLYVFTDDVGIAPHIISTGRWEPHITRVFTSLIKKGDTVLDIGANLGYFSVIAAPLVGEQGRIMAFEANPKLSALLEKSFMVNGMFRNGKAQLFNKGVMDREGEMVFCFPPNQMGGGSFFVPEKKAKNDGMDEITVPVVALDEFLGSDFTADVVKMDIEGSEPLALKGMSQLIRRSKNIKIIIEYSPNRFKKHMSLDGLIDMVESFGFNIFNLENNGAHPINRQQLLSCGFTNLLLQR